MWLSLVPLVWDSAFWTLISVSFPRLGKFSVIILSNTFCVLFSLFSFWDPYNVNVVHIMSQRSHKLSSVFKICFCFCCSDWVVPTILSSRSLKCSSESSHLLLFPLVYSSFQLTYSSELTDSPFLFSNSLPRLSPWPVLFPKVHEARAEGEACRLAGAQTPLCAASVLGLRGS